MRTRSPFLNYIADYMLVRQYSLRTVDTYLRWIASYIHFHDKRHPASMGDNEVERYLEHLVLRQNVAPRTQATALNSLSFLYKHIIKNELSLNLNFTRRMRKYRTAINISLILFDIRKNTTKNF